MTERICSLWILIELLEVLLGAQLSTSTSKERRAPMSYIQHILKWQDSASRRFLTAIKTLAQVRRLQSEIPNSQTNVQINLPATSRQHEP